MVLEFSAGEIRQEKEIKGMHIRKEDVLNYPYLPML
jgi:hypothetical protein